MAAEDAASSHVPSRSPSPVSAPPIPTAPGPRAMALQKLYADATAHVMKTCNYENFSACFPTAAREASTSLKQLHENSMRSLEGEMRKRFEIILDERHVVASLNELDSLIEDARRRKKAGGDETPVPPHTLSAQSLYISHLAPSLAQYSSSIREQQDTVQEENIELLRRVMQQRKEIESLVKGLENVVADLDASVATLNSTAANVEGLRAEMRDVDTEMRMTA